MSNKNDGNYNPQTAKVLKLGLNISVSGDPGSDFEIVLDDNNQKAIHSSSQSEAQLQSSDALELESSTTKKHELEKAKSQEVTPPQSRGAIPKHNITLSSSDSSDSLKRSELEKEENSIPKDISIINKIKSTIEHFEKFSDHIKEIPRLRNCPIATSTPFPDKYNSKSESNLVYSQYRSRNYSYLNDFNSRKDYKSTAKPDLFLKPLPAEGYYKRGIYSRFFDLESYRHYGSDSSLNKTSESKVICGKSNYDFEKYEGCSALTDPPSGILKKSDSESGDRQSASSADSIKDIKIYQTGGILIMQNFKDSMDVNEKRDISEFSAKLIENCNKLRLEMNNLQEDKPAIGNSSDESKHCGKIVQFDLSSLESQKSKLGDSPSNVLKDESSGRMESSESTSDCMKNKDTSPQGTSQSQDFPSLSTQENDSILSNQPGMSPSYASSKKLEWDSGADVGYLNLDLTKENLSTIEKIVLKGLSSDGLSEKNVVYEKKAESEQTNCSKFIMERKHSDTVIEQNLDVAVKTKNEVNTIDNTENHFTQGENKNSEGEIEREKNSLEIYSEEIQKDEIPTKFDETKLASHKNCSKVNPTAKTDETHLQVKPLELKNKSVNVNTLFDDKHCQTPVRILREYFNPLEFHKPKLKKSPKLSISKSKRPSSQRLLKASKKVVSKPTTDTFEMGISNKVYKNVEATPTLNDTELSREVEEIIIDQRFKITQNLAVGKEVGREAEISTNDKTDRTKDIKSKSRPISASSSSNNTVLPKFDNKEYTDEKRQKTPVRSKLADQITQTSDYDCESVGIQAFSSHISSGSDLKSVKKNEVLQRMTKEFSENVNMCSKNIQAFGLNYSLPKQLEHPKETALFDGQQTKSTQFFGGPLNSLPNYHSNLVAKPGESCGRALGILKTKKNSEAEMIRLKEENEKNILANDAPKLVEPQNDSKKHSSNGNKENLITRNSKSKCSKRDASQDSEKKESEQSHTRAKKKSPLFEGSDCPHTSDEVSSRILTYEMLKVHGESIDRNIIQEKYFQSQLVELEKRKMVSRSTSMEMHLQLQPDETVKEYMTTGCQYSPQSRETISGELYMDPDGDSFKGNFNRRSRRTSHYHHIQNRVDEHFKMSKTGEQNLGAGDSLPSSTQTAHSWIPGLQNSRENTSGVGRARSFEYLPGHVYESSGNLREELPSETEVNLITSSSLDSDTAKGSVSNGEAKDSEGRSTLILENSTQSSHESDRLKVLDETLAQLNIAVMKLSEKDAQMRSVTQSLLVNLWKKSGSGDSLALGEGDTSKIEIEDKDSPDIGKQRNETFSETEAVASKENSKKGIACQTEGNSSSEPELYYEEKKALKKRISEEKQCQIKWIENEIQHLNILRKLLEKQNSPIQNKKKLSPHTFRSNDDAKIKERYEKNTAEEIFPRTVTPVYGCTISLSEKNHAEEGSECQPKEREPCSAQYRMAVSLTSDCSKNWKHIVMVPVGLQVSLNNANFLKNSTEEENDKEKNLSSQDQNSPNSDESNTIGQHKPTQSDVITQFPSMQNILENNPSTSVHENFPFTKNQNHCGEENCFCLNLSNKSSLTISQSSKSKTSQRKDSPKLRFSNEESGTGALASSATDPELVQVESSSASQPVKKPVKTSGDESVDLTESIDKCRSYNSTDSKFQKASGKSECFDNHSRLTSIQSMNCKCQHCPAQLFSTASKPGIICRNSCQSSIYLNSEKSSDDSGACRCPKIQVQKSLHGTCHVIKIHGSKCCSNNKSCCSCKRQTLGKKTENQFCQTDSDQLRPTLEIKHTEAQPVLEKKTSVVEKLSCSPKVGYEKMHPSAVELALKEKSVVKRRVQEVNVPVKQKTPLLDCNCKRKVEKEKADDHPRHYFLKIEEKEIDESSELNKQKKSLEVITVTVPVKKAGKSKIYGSNIRQTRENEKPLVYASSIKCNCCPNCIENCSTQDYNPHVSSSHRKTLAEKPESSTWGSELLRPLESTSCGDLSFYPSKELPQQFSSSQENYQDKNGLTRNGSSYERVTDEGYEFRCCESCNCINQNITSSREFQNEFDSHKSRTSWNTIGNTRFYEDRKKLDNRARSDSDRRVNDWSSEPRGSQVQKPDEKNDWCGPDYYNYNKKEFMTKSELLREEKQKSKALRPSLQECLSSNRPDFYNSAERRREIINKRAEERAQRHNNRMECLLKMMQKCKEESLSSEPKKMFTTQEMREQTLKRYKKLPEVTGKIADQKKKEEYRTNRLMADVFAKKLQIEALKGKCCPCCKLEDL